MERQILKQTEVTCYSCGKAKMEVEKPGSETRLWIRCPACSEYYYQVGQITCFWNGMPSEADRATLNQELEGATDLLPEVIEHIKAMRAQLGLTEE